MVTVIIPTLNEAATIQHVIRLVKRSPLVSEIIVVDDKSLDHTVEEAKKENVRVITSTRLGKGTSMREGLLFASNNILLYLDADIIDYPEDIVERLAMPIINGDADFVKSTFDRQAGRVTELVAKPLLGILLPELTKFSQPLSGMIAGSKKLLEQITFENDYGVDIGILIDVFLLNARIKEVSIGKLENRMQSWEQLGKMSREVSRAILKRVKNLPEANLENYENIQVIRQQMDFAIQESLIDLKKMVVFDMDNTILENSFINTAADKFGFRDRLISTVAASNNPFIRTKQIARLLKGKSIGEILEVTDSIPVVFDLPGVVKELKKRGFICGIISDSYDCVTNHLKNRIGFDFTFANELEFSNSIATGEVKIPSFFMRSRKSRCEHDYCKGNVLKHIARKYRIEMSNIVCVGDGENDVCMLQMAGIGVSFCSSNNLVNLVADKIIRQRTFAPLLEIAN
jgi:glucosyl-3-phosphoglycerate synthase